MPNNETCSNCNHVIGARADQNPCECVPCNDCGERHAADNICSECDRCNSCCVCWECDGCNRTQRGTVRSPCGNCERCDDCCECHRCEGCGERYGCESFCHEDDCERCQGCCEGHDNQDGDDGSGYDYFREDDPNPEKFFEGEPTPKFPRFIGVEIECQIPNGKWAKGAKEFYNVLSTFGASTHSDGSVSGDNGYPIEIVTAPARGEAFEKQINAICDQLDKMNGQVDRTCGYHVHVDVRDMTMPQILTLVWLYARLERMLYLHVAPSRRVTVGSSYCRPWGTAFLNSGVFDTSVEIEEREAALDIATYGDLEEAKRIKISPYKHESRYHGLNLNAIHLHGTIEFRMHQGTVNREKILNWAAICGRMVEYAATHPEEEVRRLKGGPAQKLNTILRWEKEGEINNSLVEWARERRVYFLDRERKKKGLPTQRRRQDAYEEQSEVQDARRRRER